MISAKIIADSIANGVRLTTLELKYPRFIHSEFMTHRMFCLDGDSLLEFDLPKGQGEYKRVFTMTLREFAYKWFNGDSKGRSLRHRLSNMRIRQLNESTQKIETCTVRDCFISGEKEVFEITAGGMSVAGSKDHRILTVDGWKRIEELEVDKDYIITRAFGKLDEDVNDPIRLKKFGDNWKSTWLNQIRQDKLIDQNFSCYDCGTELLIASHDLHHVIPVYMDESKAFDYNNIVALCKDCHQERHRIQGWQGGTYLYGKPELLQSIKSLGHKETFDLEMNSEYENFIANGIVVHNSRNAASSRAIPIEKMIDSVEASPAMPIHWGKNQSGMQAREENIVKDEYYEGYALFEYEGGVVDAPTLWKNECAYTIQNVRKLSDAGYHKQVVNRLLEPFQWIKVIVTATEWDNFFKLRLHPDAQPEMRVLAEHMKASIDASVPDELKPGEWHLPLSMEGDLLTKIKTSVAGAARISYNNHDGSNRTIEKDINLHNQLLISGHMSPFEHCLTPMCNEELYNCQLASEFIGQQAYFRANFNRWTSYRWILENKDESYITVG